MTLPYECTVVSGIGRTLRMLPVITMLKVLEPFARI